MNDKTIIGLICGGGAVALVVGIIVVMKITSPKPAVEVTDVSAAMPSSPAKPKSAQVGHPEPVTSQRLTAAEEENARLRAQLAEVGQQREREVRSVDLNRQASAEKAKLVQQTAAARGSVSGAAWVIRANGDSTILRGLKVTVMSSQIATASIKPIAERTASLLKESAAEHRSAAADERKRYPSLISKDYDPGSLEDVWAKEADAKASETIAWMNRLEATTDTSDALKAIDKSSYVKMVQAVVDAATVKSASTNVKGEYSIADLPGGKYYIQAMFDTRDGFLLWAVPVTINGANVSVDLFNDSALVLK